MQPRSVDETTHRPGAHRFWNESFYFNFFDGSSRLGGATRIGFSPNRDRRDAFVILYLPSGGIGFVDMRAPLAADVHGAAGQRIDTPPLRFECERPFERWRVRYDGPFGAFEDGTVVGDLAPGASVGRAPRRLAVDLVFESLHPAYDFHASSTKRVAPLARTRRALAQGTPLAQAGLALLAARSLPAMSGAAHYEQAVSVRGVVAIDGVEHAVDGFGQRDHSWGVRDMRVPTGWRWISAQFGADLCFNATRVDVLGLEVSGGYAFLDGRCSGLRGFTLSPEPGAEGRFARALSLDVELESRRVLHFDVEVLDQLPVTVATEGRGTVVNESLARFAWNGRTALGIVEAMAQRFP